ncbi:hypothetical protein B4N89_02310 [Embleya scabrispora]|uniref:Minor tail protein n=1 Tax=Embleya scabrispora TaxID=159449 RepID=A0A1T3NTH2_9ACTN|nr:hypothetical protein [Embleya scabrispora]OPC79931.1 hypothetical protein B4N89_02310 [Embleya scabrispora]
MTPYRVLFCDLRSDQLLDVLPLTNLAWDDWIGKTGTLRGTIPVVDADMAARASRMLPARTAVWLERDRVIEWGGIMWTRVRARDSGGASMAIQCAGWESYLDHRILFSTWETGPGGVDQLDIARQLVDIAQAETGGDIGIRLDWSQTSGVVRDRTYSRYDLPKVRTLLDQLSNVIDGFEWRIGSYRDGDGSRAKALVLGHPRISAGSTDVVLDYPGVITDYALPEDGTTEANRWQSRGAATNRNQAEASTPLMSSLMTYPDRVADGWPLLDGSSDHSTVETLDVLDSHAAADIARAREPEVIPEVTISLAARALPPLGSWVRIRIRDVWPDVMTVRHRVVGVSVSTSAQGAPVTARLTLEAA